MMPAPRVLSVETMGPEPTTPLLASSDEPDPPPAEER